MKPIFYRLSWKGESCRLLGSSVEECLSGLRSSLGKRVCRESVPWVRIPPPPSSGPSSDGPFSFMGLCPTPRWETIVPQPPPIWCKPRSFHVGGPEDFILRLRPGAELQLIEFVFSQLVVGRRRGRRLRRGIQRMPAWQWRGTRRASEGLHRNVGQLRRD